ncbi:hypothetical protein RhiirA1_207241 [Rhizophagus irregularis]|uniref:Uncharacterized protein n=2 Tax=Rhizophagus irregularis TaxID=588596 RepID=A0A2N0RP94_9GLOM|nr:hypothetical protein GLOIN_2v1707857 [Rhizophagus irregularis DAOM 181602=DAOM 197198]PKC65116.1 hypothetical protein RhiirA1_207241 [Rhizophagus irregularis]POG60997.1 hypothetical protein GLOIN_2v1707857 [Rhizophagus irregularis DAOM 181602=DAOM 197198]GET64680.1 hypothetical protein GLOIN_2v1707857 [Rhizophagus irregularis DAOM 181602=DAOM 197198]|eukprot:XP_025167863.1 hypothetical protein GLOIN_2v1707857 [Rhizophagus irregularis DAOM 181602=DAOM 197198]
MIVNFILFRLKFLSLSSENIIAAIYLFIFGKSYLQFSKKVIGITKCVKIETQ